IGNNADTTAMTGDRVTDHNPAAMPVAMPKNVPANEPISKRASDADKCCHNTRATVSRHNVTAIATGDGRNRVGRKPAQVPNCQKAMRTHRVAAPAIHRSRGWKPPPRNGTEPSSRRIDPFPFGDRGVVPDDAPEGVFQVLQIRIVSGTSGQRPVDAEDFPHP